VTASGGYPDGAGAQDRLHVGTCNLVAARTAQLDVDMAAATGMAQHHRRGRRVTEVGVALLEQRGQDPLQVMGARSEVVLVARALPGLLVAPAFQQAGVDQLPKALREGPAGDPEVLGYLVELVQSREDLAKDEQGPSLADQAQCCGDAAVSQIKFSPLHVAKVPLEFRFETQP
jgi:hypothetical protein